MPLCVVADMSTWKFSPAPPTRFCCLGPDTQLGDATAAACDLITKAAEGPSLLVAEVPTVAETDIQKTIPLETQYGLQVMRCRMLSKATVGSK